MDKGQAALTSSASWQSWKPLLKYASVVSSIQKQHCFLFGSQISGVHPWENKGVFMGFWVSVLVWWIGQLRMTRDAERCVQLSRRDDFLIVSKEINVEVDYIHLVRFPVSGWNTSIIFRTKLLVVLWINWYSNDLWRTMAYLKCGFPTGSPRLETPEFAHSRSAIRLPDQVQLQWWHMMAPFDPQHSLNETFDLMYLSVTNLQLIWYCYVFYCWVGIFHLCRSKTEKS